MSNQEPKGWVCPIDGNCETDTAVQILKYIFDSNFINAYISGGNPALVKVATADVNGITPSIMPMLVNQISGIALFIALIFLCFVVLKSVLTSANDGELAGVSRGTGSWMGTYGRPLFAVVMLAPTISGYSMIAVLVMWVVMMSNGAANKIYMEAADYTLKSGSLMSGEDNIALQSANNLYDATFYGALHGYCAKSAYETLGSTAVRFNMADKKVDNGFVTHSFTIEDTNESGKPGISNVAGNLCGSFTLKYKVSGENLDNSRFSILRDLSDGMNGDFTYVGKNVAGARALAQLTAYKAGFRNALGATKLADVEKHFAALEEEIKKDFPQGLPPSLQNGVDSIRNAAYSLDATGWPVIQVNEQTQDTVNNGEAGQVETSDPLFAPATINIKPLIAFSESSSDVMSQSIKNYINNMGLDKPANAQMLKEYENSLMRNGWLGAGTARMRLASLRQVFNASLYSNPGSFSLTNLPPQEENNSKFNQHLESVSGVNEGVMKAFNSSSLKDPSVALSSSFATSSMSPSVDNSTSVLGLNNVVGGSVAITVAKTEKAAVNAILGTESNSDGGKLDLSQTDGDILARIQYAGEVFGIASMSTSAVKVALVSMVSTADGAAGVFKYIPLAGAALGLLNATMNTVLVPLLQEAIDTFDNLRTMMGTVIPNLPFLLLAMAAIGWFLQIIMTIFGMPLFLIMHALPGDRFMGSQQQGWVTVLALFFRPLLIISAFFIALFIYEPLVVYFTNAFFSMRDHTGMSSVTDIGYVLSYITSMRDFWYMYAASLILLTYLVFGTVQEMSDNILDWLGTNLLRNFGNINSDKLMATAAGSAMGAAMKGRQYRRAAGGGKGGRAKGGVIGGNNNSDGDDPGDLTDDINDLKASAARGDGAAKVDANSAGSFGSTTSGGVLSSPYGSGALAGGASGFVAAGDSSTDHEDKTSGAFSASDEKQSINLSDISADDVGADGEGINIADDSGDSNAMGASGGVIASDSDVHDDYTEQETNSAAYNDMIETPTQAKAEELWNGLTPEEKAELASQDNPTEAQEAVIAAGENMVKEGIDNDIDSSQFNDSRVPVDNPTPSMQEAQTMLHSMDTQEIADIAGKEGKWSNKEAAIMAAGIATGQLMQNANGGLDVRSTSGQTIHTGIVPSGSNKKEADALAKRGGYNPRPMATPTSVTKSGKDAIAKANAAVDGIKTQPPANAKNYTKTDAKDGSVVESWQAPSANGGTTTSTLTTKADGSQSLMVNGSDKNGNSVNMVNNYGASGNLLDRTANVRGTDGSRTAIQEKFDNNGNLQQMTESTVQKNGASTTTMHQVGPDGTVTSIAKGSSSKGDFEVVETSNANGDITSRTQSVSSGGVTNTVKDVYAGNGQIQRTKTINGVQTGSAMLNKGFGGSQIGTPKANSSVAGMVQNSNQTMAQQTVSDRAERIQAAKDTSAAMASASAAASTNDQQAPRGQDATGNSVTNPTGTPTGNATITPAGNASTGNSVTNPTGTPTGNSVTNPTGTPTGNSVTNPTGTPTGNATITPAGNASTGNATITPAGNASTGNSVTNPTGTPTGNATITPAGNASTGNATITPAGNASTGNATITPAGNASTGNSVTNPTGTPTGNSVTNPTGTPTGNATITPAGNASTGNSVTNPTGTPTGNSVTNPTGTPTGNATITPAGNASTGNSVTNPTGNTTKPQSQAGADQSQKQDQVKTLANAPRFVSGADYHIDGNYSRDTQVTPDNKTQAYQDVRQGVNPGRFDPKNPGQVINIEDKDRVDDKNQDKDKE